MSSAQHDAAELAPAPRAAFAARLGAAISLAALLACLAAAPASAPGAGPPPLAASAPQPLRAQNSLGAADLFAALTEPDRSAEIDALRTIRRDLTSADDPRQRDAARDRLDALLDLEERRQPEVPAALVMSSLAARIDNAIAGLEQAALEQAARAGSAGKLATPNPALPQAQVFMAAAAAALALAVSIGAGIAAALVGRRRLGDALEEAQAGFAAAEARLDRVAATVGQQSGAAQASVEAASAAARDATLAGARLASATVDAEMRLRDCLDAVDLRQSRSNELANECESVTRSLPALLAGAIETVEQRGLKGLDDAVAQLQECAGGLAAGSAALQAGAASLTQETAIQARQLGQAVARSESVAELLPEISAGLAATVVDLRGLAAAQAAPGDATPDLSDGRASALEAAISRAEGLAELLPEMTTGLAATAAQLRRDTQSQAQILIDAGLAVAQAAEATRAAGTSAEAAMARWDKAAAAQADGAASLEAGAARLRADAEQLANTALAQADNGAAIAAAAAGLNEAAAAMAAQGAARESALRDVTAAADAALAALPVETAQLIRAAAVLPAGLAALVETAASLRAEGGRLADSAAEHARLAQGAAVDVRIAAEALPAAASALAGLAAEAGAGLRGAADQVRAAASGLAQDSSASAAALQTLAARADATAGVLPVEASELAAASAALRQDAASVREAAEQILSAAAEPAANAAAIEFGALCARLAERVAGLDDAGTEIRDAAAQLRLDALCGAQAAHETGATGARLQLDLRLQTERLAALLDSGEQLMPKLAASQQGGGTPGTALAELAHAVASTRDAAAVLAERGAAQEAASARVAQAALALAAIVQPGTPAPTLQWLGGMAAQTNALLAAAGGMAETALRGDTAALPPGIAADAPALLAAIETCIGRLRGTATALAIASDTARLAA